jgi:cell division protein FtsI/penicillin-binding protein 2
MQLFKSVNGGRENILKFEPKHRRRVLLKGPADHVKNIFDNPYHGKLKCNIAYCGKTGTTQKIINGKSSHERHVPPSGGLFSANNHKIVITVLFTDARTAAGIAWGRVSAFVKACLPE